MNKHIIDHINVLKNFYKKEINVLESIAKTISFSLSNGSTIFIFGNGGSSAESHHFSAELLGRFEVNDRPALRAHCLSSDTSTITAVANDFGYNEIFSRQVEGLCTNGDLLFGISTSGTSENVLKAFEAGKKIGTLNILLTGDKNITNKIIIDNIIKVPSQNTAIIQEIHLVIIHHICRLLDKEMKNAY